MSEGTDFRRQARRRGTVFALVVSAALALAITVAPSEAYADGVFTFSGHGPAGPGGTSTAWSLPIQIYADSTATFDPADSYYQILLDGVVQTRYVEQLGHWEDDGCETWWVLEDPTVVHVFTPALVLSDGEHTVTARFRDTLGQVDETTWTFTVAFTPMIGEVAPAVATSSTRPRITAYVSDNGPGAPIVSMMLDGVAVPATWDPAAKEIVYTPPAPLSTSGTHTVSVTAVDGGGRSATKEWSFTIATGAAASFSSLYPSPGATLSVNTFTWRATATAPVSLVRNSTKAWLDGARTAMSISQPVPTQLNLSYSLYNLADGPHTLRVRVVDTNGVESEYMWTFTVAVPPTLSGQTPTPGASVALSRPWVGFTMSDNMVGPLHALMKVDGATVVDADLPQGQVRWQPSVPFADPSTHTVQVTVTDARGTPRTASWSFTTASLPPMSTSRDCASCHDANTHPFSNCVACHKNYPGYDEHYANPDAPLGECYWCHGQGVHTASYVSNCLYCHEGPWVQIPRGHDATELGVSHTTVTTGCEECHDTSLIAEHGKYPADSTFKYQCVVCHAGAPATVQAAVAAGDTSCASCHSGANHTEAHGSQQAVEDGCVECHAADLVTEHVVNRGLTCDDCHGATSSGSSATTVASSPYRSIAVALGASTSGVTGDRWVPTTSTTGGISLAYVDMDSEDVWEAMAEGDTSCDACHTSYHGDLLPSSLENTAAAGYLSWDAACSEDPGNNAGSPHGGYTASTNKCAVCHSVHRAAAGASVLTAYGPYATYAQGCIACHGPSATFTDVRVTANADGYISPHGTCTRCHVLNPHGAEGSVYPVLAVKLLNTGGDAMIGSDLTASANGLGGTMFDGSGDAVASAAGLTLGTGYLCSACHLQSFAVNTPGTDPAGGGSMTGHRVLADATGAWDHTAYGASMTATTTVAFADAHGCDACHDALAADGSSAFPHGYVDASGAVSPKTVAGSSYLWLTAGSYLGSADTTMLATAEPDEPIRLTEDGLCLKCHRTSGGAFGVGLSY
jgi:hypothetical protein